MKQTSTSSFAETAASALREPDRTLQETAAAARARLDQCVGEAASYARQQPEKALLSALAVGYVLRLLPVMGIARMFLRLALALLKPAALLYGGAKLWQQVQPSGSPRLTQKSP